jgi:hypothetical protein
LAAAAGDDNVVVEVVCVETGEKKDVIVRCDGEMRFFFLGLFGPAGFVCTGVLVESIDEWFGVAPEVLE